jgi:hypothetical protein
MPPHRNHTTQKLGKPEHLVILLRQQALQYISLLIQARDTRVSTLLVVSTVAQGVSIAKMSEKVKKEKSPSVRKNDKPDAPVAVDASKVNPSDAAFRPSPALLNAQSASALLKSVDGPDLESYSGKESIYVGRSVPIAAGSSLNVPIQVATPGSIVEYAVEILNYDIAVSITAEREEGITVVRVS